MGDKYIDDDGNTFYLCEKNVRLTSITVRINQMNALYVDSCVSVDNLIYTSYDDVKVNRSKEAQPNTPMICKKINIQCDNSTI